MALENNFNIQDIFLNHIRKSCTPINIFLINGVKLYGILLWFDKYSFLIKRDDNTQLIYKTAVSTIIPQTPLPFLNQKINFEKKHYK